MQLYVEEQLYVSAKRGTSLIINLNDKHLVDALIHSDLKKCFEVSISKHINTVSLGDRKRLPLKYTDIFKVNKK